MSINRLGYNSGISGHSTFRSMGEKLRLIQMCVADNREMTFDDINKIIRVIPP